MHDFMGPCSRCRLKPELGLVWAFSRHFLVVRIFRASSFCPSRQTRQFALVAP